MLLGGNEDREFENADLAAGLRLIAEALSTTAQADDAAYLDQREGALALRIHAAL
jgi:hypothetical protein